LFFLKIFLLLRIAMAHEVCPALLPD